MMASSSTDGVTPASAMPNFMDRFGERLTANGYPVLPIWPGAKCPGRFSSVRGWEGYKDWTRHCDRLSSQFEIGIWRRWPGCGVGVACGKVGALDIDVMDQELAEEIEARARTELGDTPAMRIGQAPKRLLVYRAAEPFKPIKRHPLEFLAHGNQFVAYAIHPETNLPYAWPHEGLHEVDIARLPFVTEEQACRFMDAAFALVPPELRQGRIRKDRGREFYWSRDGDKLGTPEAISAALDWLPNDDEHYDDWIAILLATKMAVGEAGRDAWLRWSAKSGKDVPAYSLKTWNAAKPNGELGAGTIYREAMSHGWTPEPHVILNGAAADAVERVTFAGNLAGIVNGHDFAEAASASSETKDEEKAEPAEDIRDILVAEAPGILGEMVSWMTDTAVSPQAWLALGAALCAVGVVMGRRYRLERPDTRSNLFVLALADSGGGKDHPRKCVRRALLEAGLGSYLGGEHLASGAAVLSRVAKHPALLFQIDEFGHFVRAVLDPKSHAHHRREIMTALTTLWSSASETVLGTEYANDRERPRQDIHQPCVCLYGSTVPAEFWAALQSGSLGDGSVARYLLFQTPCNYPNENADPEPIENRLPQVAKALKAVVAGPAGHETGNVAGLMAPNTCGDLFTVPMEPEAEEIEAALRAEHLAMKRSHEGSALSSIAARYREHVRRVALVAAVADNPAQPVVTAAIVDWAARLVRHCLDLLMIEADRHIADTLHQANLKKVMKIIRQERGWIDARTLARKTQFLNRKERNDLLAQLAEEEAIEIAKEAGATKPFIKIRVRRG